MNILFEFLCDEPIENVITCMRYRMDRVIFFGYRKTIDEQKKPTDDFLKNYCGVQEISSVCLLQDSLQSDLQIIDHTVMNVRKPGNHLFIDITGGESLALVAFGMLAEKYDLPLHSFDIEKDQLIELKPSHPFCLSKLLKREDIMYSLERMIELHGGCINTSMFVSDRNVNSKEYGRDLTAIWDVACKRWKFWNPFSDFLKRNFAIKHGNIISDVLVTAHSQEFQEQIDRIFSDLAGHGILLNYHHIGNRYSFVYKNEKIKDCLLDGGSILELHTWKKLKERTDECLVGVHIDWDGIIHQSGFDVVNEVDVLALKGIQPIFISCKSGKMDASRSLHALYELETVANRFGGKYARRILLTAQKMNEIAAQRAEQMGIEIKQMEI